MTISPQLKLWVVIMVLNIGMLFAMVENKKAALMGGFFIEGLNLI